MVESGEAAMRIELIHNLQTMIRRATLMQYTTSWNQMQAFDKTILKYLLKSYYEGRT